MADMALLEGYPRYNHTTLIYVRGITRSVNEVRNNLPSREFIMCQIQIRIVNQRISQLIVFVPTFNTKHNWNHLWAVDVVQM